jgi:hypothetical protein
VGEVLEHADRIVGAEDGDGAGQPDALGADGQGCEDYGRRGDEVIRAVVLSDREEV